MSWIDGPWDIYVFPGGKVATAKTRIGARLWIAAHTFILGEIRAINTATGEHIVR